jgi:uncharacterized protein (DUF849 family)
MIQSDNIRKDYFVAAAITGLLGGRNHNDKPYTTTEIAELAVKIANATMVELEKDTNSKVIK